MGALAVTALALVVIAAFGAALWSKRRAPRSALAVAGDLPARTAAAARAFADAAPWQPATAADAPEGAAAIEAALIAGDAPKALAAAEAAVAAAPEAAAPRVWLAWALCASAEPAAALVQLETARELAGGAPPGGALALYVEARAGHLAFERATGSAAAGAVPPLVTAGDLAIVTLAGAKGGAAWLSGAEEAQVSPAEVSAAMAEHRAATARALAHVLDALAAAPGFADAAYLAARLAVKAGAIAEARALFAALEPRIAGRPDADSFARDVADLADPSGAVAAALAPPKPAIAATAKRSRGLKVL